MNIEEIILELDLIIKNLEEAEDNYDMLQVVAEVTNLKQWKTNMLANLTSLAVTIESNQPTKEDYWEENYANDEDPLYTLEEFKETHFWCNNCKSYVDDIMCMCYSR